MNEASTILVRNKEYVCKKDKILYLIIKRVFDFLMSLISIILFSPLFIIMVVAIRVDSKGKAIYKHKRIGKNGKYIYLYKFRTMYTNSKEMLDEILKDPERKKEWDTYYKLTNDPRVTKVGKFLRKTSLDELPQLLNILFGEMSFVGPRPVVDGEIEKYGEDKDKFLSVLPGLTGWWACNGRSTIGYENRKKLELYYVDNRSILLDLKVLFKTFIEVFKRTGAK